MLEESLRLYEAAEDITGMAHGHIRLGEVAQALGDFPLARRHYEASRAIFDEVGTRWGRLWHHFGLLALDEGDPATARTHLTACLRLHESLGGERQWLLSSLAAFTVLAVAEDQPGRALTLAGAAEALRERTGAVLQPTERGRFERAVAVARGALSPARGPGQATGAGPDFGPGGGLRPPGTPPAVGPFLEGIPVRAPSAPPVSPGPAGRAPAGCPRSRCAARRRDPTSPRYQGGPALLTAGSYSAPRELAGTTWSMGSSKFSR